MPRKLRSHSDKFVIAAQGGPLTRELPPEVTAFPDLSGVFANATINK